MNKCAKCNNMVFGDPPSDHICSGCKKLYASIVIDNKAIEASKKDKGIFVRLVEESFKTSLDNITAHHILLAQTDWELNGANKMLEVIQRWLNIEPIEKEIWEDFSKKD